MVMVVMVMVEVMKILGMERWKWRTWRNNPDKGTVLGEQCNGTTLVTSYADGQGNLTDLKHCR